MSSPLNRRLFLRGALGGLALPLLPSALPRSAWSKTPSVPNRLLFWYCPCGFQMEQWTPELVGEGYDLRRMLAPLKSVQADVSVLTGLTQESGFYEIPGDHARGTGTFLTAQQIYFTEGADIYNGISADQVAAQAMGHLTPFPSLELGMDGGTSVGDCDSGYSCAYVRNISWAGPQTPMPKLTDPLLVFERLFGERIDGFTVEEVLRRNQLRVSVLDHVMESTASLQGQLGVSDGRKLDEYLTGVRELERRVQNFGEGLCAAGEAPVSSSDFPTNVRLMTDLTVKALECDQTRIITFMMGNGGSNRVFEHLGISDGHHYLSHHGGDPSYLEQLYQIGTWEVAEFAYLIEQLSNVETAGGGRLIDHTLAMLSSEIEDGDTHWHRNMPVLLAGSGGGVARPGRHIVYDDTPPIANLFLSMLSSVGVSPGTHGADGSALLDGLT